MSTTSTVQEDATGALRLGCGAVLALVVPLWLLIAASALQLVPELRGQWMFDPLENSVEFVEYGFFVQWFRGGVIATGILGLASPFVGLAVLIGTGIRSIDRVRNRSEALRYEQVVGAAPLDVDLVVRKRVRGETETAIPIEVVRASGLRRLLARLTDLVILFAAYVLGAGVGILATASTYDWGDAASTWPIVGAGVAMVTVSLVQWAFVIDRGQTAGKLFFDIREVEADRDSPAPWVRGVLARHLVPEFVVYVVAGGMAWVTGAAVVSGLQNTPVAELLLLDAVRVGVTFAAWPVSVVVLELTRSAGILFGLDRTLHDRLSRTRVVRTSVGDPTQGPEAPMGFRMLARTLDGLVGVCLVAMPLAAGGILVQGAGLPADLVLGACGLVGGLLALSFAAWQWMSLSSTGTTLGKRRLGIRVERVDGTAPSFLAMVVMREWVGVGFVGAILPVIWPVVDAVLGLGDDGRTGHDRLAATRVVWASSDAPPVD